MHVQCKVLCASTSTQLSIFKNPAVIAALLHWQHGHRKLLSDKLDEHVIPAALGIGRARELSLFAREWQKFRGGKPSADFIFRQIGLVKHKEMKAASKIRANFAGLKEDFVTHIRLLIPA